MTDDRPSNWFTGEHSFRLRGWQIVTLVMLVANSVVQLALNIVEWTT